MGLGFLKKIANKIAEKKDSLFTYSTKKQEKFLKKFREPKNCVERSFFQYRCQMKMYGAFLRCASNVVAFPTSMKYLNKSKKRKVSFKEEYDAVFFDGGKPINIIPDSVAMRFLNIKSSPELEGSLTKEDVKYLKGIFKKHPFSWLFWLKAIIKISQYSRAIIEYNPKSIISCDEFSFTSSILTDYCRKKGVLLINVMHGEKLYYMRDSFVEYDEFFVWDEYYAELLKSLRAENTQFRIEEPASLKIIQEHPVEKTVDYTYYLAGEPKDKLKLIAKTLQALKQAGFKVVVRAHPRYADYNIINEVFADIELQDTANVTIEQSLLQTKSAISLYSTVLNQAYHAKINVVIDDITDVERYQKLSELKYIMLHVEHDRLSDVLEKINEKTNKENC